jgi:hypothetical protein
LGVSNLTIRVKYQTGFQKQTKDRKALLNEAIGSDVADPARTSGSLIRPCRYTKKGGYRHLAACKRDKGQA